MEPQNINLHFKTGTPTHQAKFQKRNPQLQTTLQKHIAVVPGMISDDIALTFSFNAFR